MDNDSNVTGQKPVIADTHNASELVHEAQERHLMDDHAGPEVNNAHAHSGSEVVTQPKLESDAYADEKRDSEDSDSDDALPDDLFVSFPPLKGVPPEESPLTVRAVLIGIVLGSLCNASNVYLGTFLTPAKICATDEHPLTNHLQQVSRRVSLSPPPCLVLFSATVSSPS